MTGDERFARPLARFEHREEFWSLTRAYTSTRTTAHVLEEAGLLRIPVAPVLDAASIPSFEQFVARQVLVDHPSGRFRQPRIPYRLDGRPTPPFGRVAEPRQHDGAVAWEPRPARPAAPGGRLPLDGVRVIDLTSWWAGPCATQVLGFLGADVIKVESTVRPDLMRYSSAKSPGDAQWWEWGPMAHAANTNKRGVTIDLTRPEGRELALDLAASADVVVENYTPRVLAQFGLEWKDLHAVNPRLNLVRMPAFGLDGPWRDRPGFAQTMESLTGLAAGTGWPDGSPVLVGGAGDPVAGLHASFATLVALVATRNVGLGCLVESTMVEAALNAAAGPLIATQLTGVVPGRTGNRSTVGSAPQGVYRCADDGWVALEVEHDDQWQRLCSVLGPPPSLPLGELASRTGRLAHHDGLDRWLEQCFTDSDEEELVGRLIGAGVPAGAVIPPPRVVDNPQLRHRGLFEVEEHPLTGSHRVPGLPATVATVGSWVRAPSPMLGQHNEEVLAGIGVDEGRLAELAGLGIIGRAPVGLCPCRAP